jgi:hypothetical protein
MEWGDRVACSTCTSSNFKQTLYAGSAVSIDPKTIAEQWDLYVSAATITP